MTTAEVAPVESADQIKGTVDGADATIKLTAPAASTSEEQAASTEPALKRSRADDVQLRLVEPGLEDLVRAYGAAAEEEEKADDAVASAKARLKWATSMRESVGREIARASQGLRQLSLGEVVAHKPDASPAFEDRYVLSGTNGTVIGGGRFMRIPQEDNKDLCMCGAAMDVGGDVHDTVHGVWLETQDSKPTPEETAYPRVPSAVDPAICNCGARMDASDDDHQRQHTEFVAAIAHELAPSTIISASKKRGSAKAASVDGAAT